VPIINTGLFIAGSFIFFQDWIFAEGRDALGAWGFILIGVVGWNFLIELGSTVLLSTITNEILLTREAIQR
jgi:hypothetical protein